MNIEKDDVFMPPQDAAFHGPHLIHATPTRRPTTSVSRRLAVDGGEPAFSQPLHVGGPHLPDRVAFFRRLEAIFDRRWLTNNGCEVREFEQRVAAQIGVRHCIATSSGTSALSVLAASLDLKGEVIMPSFTFIATAHAFATQGLTPVFADIDPTTYCVDPRHVAQLITDSTSAILGVHLWGRACDVDALAALADRHHLPLIFDAAHAFGCTRNGQMIGKFGVAEAFSFHATKYINAGEGGAVVTNDDALADRLRQFRNFGFSGTDCVESLGINAKMNEMCAALGNASLDSMTARVQTNRTNFHAYERYLRDINGIELLRYDATEQQNFQYVVARVDARAAGLNRDRLVEILSAENVLARKYFYPGCHRATAYDSPPHSQPALPVTERLADEVISLPSGPAVTPADIKIICHIIRQAFACYHCDLDHVK